MTSCCPDPASTTGPGARGRRGRLAVALLIAVAALAGPAVGSTSARFTSRTETPPLRIEVPMPSPSDTSTTAPAPEVSGD